MEKLYSDEFEKHLLGCMLIDNSIIDDVTAHLRENYFMGGRHQLFFKKIKELYETHQSCDLLMLNNATDNKYLKEISDLTTDIASSVNYDFYISQIHKLYVARQTRSFLGETATSVSEKNIDDVLYKIDDYVNSCMTDVTESEPSDGKQMAIKYMELLQERQKNRGKLTGIDTGFDKLNSLTGGFQEGTMVAIAARTSIGKSALADQVATNIALNGIGTVTFSLEMTKEKTQERRIAREGKIPLKKLQNGLLSLAQIQQVNQTSQRLYDCGDNIVFYDSSSISCEYNEIVSKIRIHAKQGYKVFFIDHIGLIDIAEKEGMPVWEKTGYITKRLKQLANKLKIVIVLVCQLSRDAEGKDPQLSQIRGSGSVEQDCDTVILIHRERQQNQETQLDTKLKVVKDRDGECGDIDCLFFPQFTRFEELENKKEFNYVPKGENNPRQTISKETEQEIF